MYMYMYTINNHNLSTYKEYTVNLVIVTHNFPNKVYKYLIAYFDWKDKIAVNANAK